MSYLDYKGVLDQYVAGTATLEELTKAVTPEVAEIIGREEHAAAKNRTAKREAMADAARCTRQKRRKKRVAAATRYALVMALVAFVALCVVVVIVVAFALGEQARHDQQAMLQIEQQRIAQIEQQWQARVRQQLTPAQQARFNAIQQQLAQQGWATP